MHARRRVYGAGAVLTAAAAVVLSGSPAQAACSADSTQQWQVGAQLGHAPVEFTGTGGPLAALVDILPVSRISVEDATGENLVRVDAASVRTRTERPALPDDLDLVGPVRGVKVTEATERARTPEAATRTAVDRAARIPGQVDAATSPAREQQIPLRANGTDNVLAGPLNWVPIESFGVFGSDGDGVPWTSGLALMVLGAGVAGVTVVARRRVGA